MKKTLLISEEEIKNQSLIEMSVAPKSIRVILNDVQHNQLRKILGNTLFNSIITEVDNSLLTVNPVAISVDTLALITDYIQPFLVAAVIVDFIVLNSFKLTNKGLLQMNDNEASTVNIQGIEGLKNYYDTKANTAKLELIEHLKTDEDVECSDATDTNVTSSLTGLYIESFNDFSDYFNRGRNRYL
ncbi:hypothetical protein [Pedobacter sp. L105]|uniref:DUF6712 family protein n=1 Tax=Pedobacter sp. L105 TaxID=1641871 RepID=UPI00131E4ECD|nr:hypothetical protein [Pedobacter sp. L105]